MIFPVGENPLKLLTSATMQEDLDRRRNSPAESKQMKANEDLKLFHGTSGD